VDSESSEELLEEGQAFEAGSSAVWKMLRMWASPK